MRLAALSTAVVLLAACAPVPKSTGESAGHFTFVRPTSGTEGRRAVRWAYGFQFTVDPKTVTQVNLACGDIQGSGVTVTQDEIDADAAGAAIWYGPELLLRRESVPWLFSASATSAICQAIVSREGLPDSVSRMNVQFTKAMKVRMIDDLERSADLQRAQKQDQSQDP